MADTRAAAGLTVQQWDDKFHTEYFQDSLFPPLYGTNGMAAIHVKEDLTKKKGDAITFAFLAGLSQDAVTGSDPLEGSEEDMGSRSFRLSVDKRRNGVRIAEMEEQRSAISLRNAAKPQLLDWAKRDTRDLIVEALGSINGVAYADATETQKDAWLTDNADRVLFGAAIGNNAANDHSASLLNIDATTDKLTRASLRLMKRFALNARNPRIAPVTDPGNGKRTFIAYVHPNAMRDLYDSMDQTLRETAVQDHASRLFEGGDLLVDGVLVKELDDMPVYDGVGASGVDVSPVYLLGRQAVGVAWARRWRTIAEEFDYGDKHGVAVDGIYGVAKLRFGSGAADTDDAKDHGVVTGYFASVADA